MTGEFEFFDKDGRRYARFAGGARCDFCLAPDPAWEYPAAGMEIVGHPAIGRSDDEWGACDECRRLIDAHRVGELVERVVKMQPIHRPPGLLNGDLVAYPPLPIARRLTRRNVLRFMDARRGPARPYQ